MNKGELMNIKTWGAMLSFLMFISCMLFLYLRSKTGAPWAAQAFGMVLLVPTIVMLAVSDVLSKDMIAVLIGGVAGYIFGQQTKGN